MNSLKTTTLSAVAVLALVGMSACSDPGANIPQPGEGTGGPNASQPVDQPSVGVVEEPAPEGGAAARINDVEETVGKVSCSVMNGQWTMSGGDDAGAKVAVTATEDRSTVTAASVVLSDGTVASLSGGQGSATIAWDGETFTVTGRGPFLDLNDVASPSEDADEADFVITATCAG
ncbi:MAG: lipoprotein LpqH [Propionibacteriaceae bacterium]|nr:lipoprotein LpqH [Propionibacteriaceae bacterium]